MKAALFEQVFADRRAKRPVAVVTRLADGAQVLVHDDGPSDGAFAGAAAAPQAAVASGGGGAGERPVASGETAVPDAAAPDTAAPDAAAPDAAASDPLALTAEQLAETRKRLRGDRSGMLASSGATLFARCHAQAPRMVLVGAVHIAQALAPMAAMAGYEVIVIDPRRAFATSERLPGVSMMTDWPDAAMDKVALDAQTAVVTLSHDPKLDDPALIAALRSNAFYIGALGSTRTHAKRVERLTAAGLGDAIGRIRAPIGLDLGGRSPVEIAVAILAQVIQVRYAQ
ncbi:MAG: XdhC family protein [Burkholderiaceae bacterium]|nr:XdhC family protein [Burkholderiaceae bacterium]